MLVSATAGLFEDLPFAVCPNAFDASNCVDVHQTRAYRKILRAEAEVVLCELFRGNVLGVADPALGSKFDALALVEAAQGVDGVR